MDTKTEIVSESGAPIPVSYALEQNYPNPFNPATTIEFALPKAGFITLALFNLKGERVVILLKKQLSAGIHKFNWDASGLASGVYLYRLEADGFIRSRKFILIR